MQISNKTLTSVVLVALVVFVVLASVSIGLYSPKSRVQFSSLELREQSGSGCIVEPSCLAVCMEYDCRFAILLPSTELPEVARKSLSLRAKLKCMYDDFYASELPVGLGGVSVPIHDLENCEVLVETGRTYNVIPGMPLPIARFTDENGMDRMVYVAAKMRD